MSETVLVRPRHGLILDGIPRKGAELPRALAEEWIADQLVERVEVIKPEVRQPPIEPGEDRTPKNRRTK